MTQHILVWDLETVPDLKRYAAANGMGDLSEDEVRDKLNNKFPKLLYHSIVCIGALIARNEDNQWKVEAIGAPHVNERDERALIQSFVDRIAELRPQLVTFNGSGFDLPVLRYRAMINEVAAPGLSMRAYFNRYTEDALDLCDVLSSFSPNAKAKLDEICLSMGLPGKPEGIDGSEVASYFQQGRIKEIADYCETDVVNTYRVWLRHELFRGKLTEAEFKASEENIRALITAHANSKPHLQNFVHSQTDPR